MASPVVTLSPAGPLNMVSGQSVEIGVFASDADNRVVFIDYPVRDLAGNVSPFRQTVNLSDPLTADAPVDVSGAGFVFAAVAAQPGELARWRVTAP
jgi:hypothetical protein